MEKKSSFVGEDENGAREERGETNALHVFDTDVEIVRRVAGGIISLSAYMRSIVLSEGASEEGRVSSSEREESVVENAVISFPRFLRLCSPVD